MPRTLALYSNANGEARAALLLHPSDVDLTDTDLSTVLPEFNEGCTLHLIPHFIIDLGDNRTDLSAIATDGYGQPTPCALIEVSGIAQG